MRVADKNIRMNFLHRRVLHAAEGPCLRALRFTLLFACAGVGLLAQELSLLGGVMQATESRETSYSYHLDYRQNFNRNFAASLTYINEGHVPGHHRDGYAVQAWGRFPTPHDHFSVSLGLGAYFFYDTQTLPGGGSADVHDTAPIISLSGTGYLSNRMFYRLELSQILPAHEMKATNAVIGLGFWFGQNEKPTPGEFGHAPDAQASITENELTVFLGQSVVNTFFSQSARAYALEYRHGFGKHVDWTASFVYEGNPEIVRRSGFATQAWAVNNFFEDRIAVGIGLGPYVFIDRKQPAGTGRINPAAIAPLASLSIAARLSDDWNLRLIVDRVTSSYNRDADIFLLGLGYRW
jgi:hypothetical protein